MLMFLILELKPSAKNVPGGRGGAAVTAMAVKAFSSKRECIPYCNYETSGNMCDTDRLYAVTSCILYN